MQHSNDSRIHVALSPWDLTDDYNRHAGVTLLSLLDHCSLPVTAHLLYDANLSKGKEREEAYNRDCYQKIADRYGCELCFHHVEMPEWVNYLPAIKRFTPGTLLRLYLPDLLSNINKVIYLDCDTVIMIDINELWELKLEDKFLAACADSILTKSKSTKKYWDEKNIPAKTYFNAGVIVFNISKIQNFDKPLTDTTLEYLYKNKNLKWLDQDALNWYCQENYMLLDEKYNIHPSSFKNIYNSTSEFIIHYAIQEQKPWKRYNGEIDNYYWKYLMQTPWCDNPENLLRYIREAPDISKSLLMLQKDFFGNIGGSIREKILTAIKFTISIWKNFFSKFLSILKNR